MPIPTTRGCKYEPEDKVVGDNQFNIFIVNCPLLRDRPIHVSYTDTEDNWAQTVEHCANVLTEEKIIGDKITRTYAVWADALINTVTFYRPNSISKPEPHDIGVFKRNTFKRPDDAAPVDCATAFEDTTGGDDSSND